MSNKKKMSETKRKILEYNKKVAADKSLTYADLIKSGTVGEFDHLKDNVDFSEDDK